MSKPPSGPFLLGLIFLTISILAHSTVPPSKTFKYVNSGKFSTGYIEYNADYRVLNPYASPFQLCFYNTTPGAYILGLYMGNPDSKSTVRWVWDANRGNPVGENATLTFSKDGNLVLAEADGRIAWQTVTSNKGVVSFELLSNGNIVLRNKQGEFVWQSFDHPTDTLFVSQALQLDGGDRLISRVSDLDGSQGIYSFVLEKKRLVLYLKSKNAAEPLVYYSYALDYYSYQEHTRDPVSSVVFNAMPVNNGFATDLRFDPYVGAYSTGGYMLGRPMYNATLSMLRLGSDGSLKVYTYNDKLDIDAWEVTYSLFDRDGLYGESECKFPNRCGALGVCEDSQCVACPTPKGLLGWSKQCALPRLPPCNGGVKSTVDYYKVVGVEHFSSEYTQGGRMMKLGDCRDNCSGDCKCLGFFYMEMSSKCLLAPMLGTLIKVANQTHVAYIKTSSRLT